MRRQDRERGVVMIFVALALPALIALLALVVNAGLAYSARTQLQNAADAAAIAAMHNLQGDGSSANARAEAQAQARRNKAIGRDVELDPKDVVFGRFDFDSRAFTAGIGFGAPAVKVTARRAPGVSGGALRTFFGPFLGIATMEVAADAVAAIQRRDLVLAQDRTASFIDEFPSAVDADRNLVTAMADQSLSGDQVGVVSFARDHKEEARLTELYTGEDTVIRAINAMEVCKEAGKPGGPCYGTDIGAGIDSAREMLERDANVDGVRVIVVVSDGAPCFLEKGNRAVEDGQAEALAAADRAEDAKMNLFVITLEKNKGGTHVCEKADARFNESLARGFGRGFTTSKKEDLDELLISILKSMPVHLVK